MTGGREAAHGSLTVTCRLMRGFGPVVEPSVPAMLNTWHDLLLCRLVAPKLVGDQDAWHVRAPVEQRTEKLLGRRLVPPTLHHDIKGIPILIDCPPYIRCFAVDLEKDLIQVPRVSRLRTSSPKLVCV